MKKHIIILLLSTIIFCLFNCNSSKVSKTSNKDKNLLQDSVEIVEYEINRKTYNNDFSEFRVSRSDASYYRSNSKPNGKPILNGKLKLTSNSEQSSTAKIVDNTTIQHSKIEGLIAYSVPDEMKVGEYYNVKIRITKDSTEKQTLIVGDTHIPINDTTVNSTITIESIRVSSIMSASLVGNDSEFKITSKSTEVQNIESFGYTEWEWSVMPLKSGENPLKLIIKVRLVSEDGEKSFKDIVVFEKNVLTKTNIGYSITNMFNKYWQWSLSTLVIPFIVWLYNRKKKKKEQE